MTKVTVRWVFCAGLSAGVLGCGDDDGAAASPQGDALAAADAADASDAALADTTAQADSAQADAAAPTKIAVKAAAFATQICAATQACCGQVLAGCDATVAAELMHDKLLGGIEAAAQLGELALDPALEASSTTAFDAALAACDRKAALRAVETWRSAWIDTAAVDQDCHAAAPLGCGGGEGACVMIVPPDGWKCVAAKGKDESCSATLPCGAGLSCRNGTLSRDLRCVAPGSTCHLSDKCLEGFACQSGQCVPDTQGAPAGTACKVAEDCRYPLTCYGTCKPNLCKLAGA